MKSLTKKQEQQRNEIAQSRKELNSATIKYNSLMATCKHKYIKRGVNAFCIICSSFSQSLYCEESPTNLCTQRWVGNGTCQYCRDDLEDKFHNMQAAYNYTEHDGEYL